MKTKAEQDLVREILLALCRRDGLSVTSDVLPGEPARNYELAMRLRIGQVFGLIVDQEQRVADLETLVKVFASDESPHGSESFQRVRDEVNPRLRALLMEVLGG